MTQHKIKHKHKVFEKHFSYVIDRIKSGFIFFDEVGDILYYNHYFSKLFDIDPNEIISKNIMDILDLKESILEHLKHQSNIEFTNTIDINDVEILFNISITRIDNQSKDVFGYIIINSLSSMERQVDDLLMRELDTQRMIDEALIGVFMVDVKHRIIRTNKTFCQLLDYKPYELHNLYSWTILNSFTKETVETAFVDMAHATNIVQTDFIKKDGSLINLKVMGKGGKIKGEPVMIYFIDTFPKE
ncbi:MAG: PAS domain-containing protein [Tenericutes bacterium]|nr:PAS domain-containing protein [Mycoplasmatota bacterium]